MVPAGYWSDPTLHALIYSLTTRFSNSLLRSLMTPIQQPAPLICLTVVIVLLFMYSSPDIGHTNNYLDIDSNIRGFDHSGHFGDGKWIRIIKQYAIALIYMIVLFEIKFGMYQKSTGNAQNQESYSFTWRKRRNFRIPDATLFITAFSFSFPILLPLPLLLFAPKVNDRMARRWVPGYRRT